MASKPEAEASKLDTDVPEDTKFEELGDVPDPDEDDLDDLDGM